jgi:hypothetical protein
VTLYGTSVEGLGASHVQETILQGREGNFSKFMLPVSEMKLPE